MLHNFRDTPIERVQQVLEMYAFTKTRLDITPVIRVKLAPLAVLCGYNIMI